jgi:hypothetical protein
MHGNFAMKAAFFLLSADAPKGQARSSGILDRFRMSTVRVLLLFALIPPALAQTPPAGRTLFGDSYQTTLEMPSGARFDLGFSEHPAGVTPVYWSRSFEEASQLEARFGVHPGQALVFQPTAVEQVPLPGHPQFRFVQELRWPAAQSLTGLQFERKDLLFHGDRVSIRATSDFQAVAQKLGLLKSGPELDALALLGWRSHSQFTWQLGEPTHEIQWQLSARLERRAYAQTGTVGFEALRRF